ncbi:MAG: FAD-dependent oxidoreductase [Methanomassiliicoccales archaeon]|nr:FAD-dependent oxidoreductase [Methanomassiliicoccales archaeon]
MAKVIVVGGGPAGLACAAELAKKGVSCTILEKGERLGGRSNELSCKGQVHCRQCDVCRVHRLRDQVLGHGSVSVLTGVELEQVERSNGRYRFDLIRPTEAIDAGRCSRCGKCVEVCPTGAMTKVAGKIRLERGRCRSIQGLECERCVSVCPVAAIDLFGEEHLNVCGEAVVVATGSSTFSAKEDRRLGYGEVPGVITSLELEALLEGRGPLNGGNRPKIAFLLCVGSRTCRAGTAICSSVCCQYSLRQALSLKEKLPQASISMFIMDWRGMREDDPLLTELRGTDIQVIRSRPAEIGDEGGRPNVRYAADGQVFSTTFDLAVLAVGLLPNLKDELADQLSIPRNTQGFLDDGNCQDRNIFLAGSCTGPKDIKRCVAEGILAASKAAERMEGEDG